MLGHHGLVPAWPLFCLALFSSARKLCERTVILSALEAQSKFNLLQCYAKIRSEKLFPHFSRTHPTLNLWNCVLPVLHICAVLRSARNSIMLACNIRPSTGHLSQPCGTAAGAVAGAGARAGVEPAICLSKLCRPGDIYTPQQRQVDGQQQWITKYQVHGMCLEQDCAQNYARQVQQGMRRPDTTIEQAGSQAARQAGGVSNLAPTERCL